MVSVIIPTYNDSRKIKDIVKTLKQVKDILEIIIVDDGSSEEHKQIFRSIKGVKLITHKINQGKSFAMKSGVLASEGDLTMFIDADLSNLTPSYAQALLSPVKEKKYDMTISLRGGGGSEQIVKKLHLYFAQALSGERVLHKFWITNNMDIFHSKGYCIESEINKRFLGKLRVAFVDLPNLKHDLKVNKFGIKGLVGDFRMLVKVIKHIGVKEFIRQSKIISKIPVLKVSSTK